jgi:cation diffusion facilitator family transporter
VVQRGEHLPNLYKCLECRKVVRACDIGYVTPPAQPAQRIALVGMLASALLAVAKIWIGLRANSTSAVADGLESAADVVASGVVFLGLWAAAQPADENHPYGHGRFEILAALAVGILLLLAGIGISSRSISRIGLDTVRPSSFAVWPILLSLVVKQP